MMEVIDLSILVTMQYLLVCDCIYWSGSGFVPRLISSFASQARGAVSHVRRVFGVPTAT